MNDTAAMPLSGLKVIDFTTYIAAPCAAMTLGYLGADVIKIEPAKGDPVRGDGAFLNMPVDKDRNPLFDSVNGYKRGIALNLRSEEGKSIMLKLLKDADVFVTNYRLKALQAIGISYEQLHELNPKLVYAQMEGYGALGPDADAKAFDSVAYFSRSGISHAEQYKECPPMITPYGAGDIPAGMSLVAGVLSMLYKVSTTGVGGKVTTSLLSSGMWTMSCAMARSRYVEDIRPSLERSMINPGQHHCRLADGRYVRVLVWDVAKYWEPLCSAFGLDYLKDDPRFCSAEAVKEHPEDYIALLDSLIGKMTAEELNALFKASDIPFGIVQSPYEAGHDPQAEANGYVCDVEYPQYNDVVRFSQPPIKIEGAAVAKRSRGPMLGEQTEDILTEMGYPESQIMDFLASGTAFQRAR